MTDTPDNNPMLDPAAPTPAPGTVPSAADAAKALGIDAGEVQLVIEWATNNLDTDERLVAQQQLNSWDHYVAALASLRQRRNQAIEAHVDRQMREAKADELNRQADLLDRTQGFTNGRQIIAAQKDWRYQNDPAYRLRYEAKLAVTDPEIVKHMMFD